MKAGFGEEGLRSVVWCGFRDGSRFSDDGDDGGKGLRVVEAVIFGGWGLSGNF